ncbi:LysR family transcriptional regulator [Tropicimonas sp. IMCC34043]|uniref:LysR family transcriptional regulator n=1 Tax=Tropicimonas sp. IMCC34043 TaxID=2248760 RepID=UPI000E28873E|nr:LysR family transcriptional regulator [Tropicimonas sp. IMCC34043]
MQIYRSACIFTIPFEVHLSYLLGMADVRLIRYFIAVVEERNITRAAERLGIQQPPLSVQLKKLEQIVGAQLLKRIPGGVEPTAAGLVLYSDYRVILEQLQVAEQNARRVDRGLSGRLVLGVTHSTISHPLVKEPIRKFLEQYSDVTLEIKTAGSREVYLGIAENQLDLGFVRPLNWHSAEVREDHIVSEPMVVALPQSAPHEPRWATDGLSLQEVLQFKLIMYRDSAEPMLFNATTEAFSKQGLNLDDVQLCPTVNASLELVSTGLGAAIVPSSMAARIIPEVSFFKLNEVDHVPSEIALVRHKAASSIVAKNFRRMVLDRVSS